MEADAGACPLLERFLLFIRHIKVSASRVLPLLPAQKKDPSVVKRLVDHCLVQPFGNRVRVVVSLQDDIVAEEQRMDLLLVDGHRLVDLSKLGRGLKEAQEALVDQVLAQLRADKVVDRVLVEYAVEINDVHAVEQGSPEEGGVAFEAQLLHLLSFRALESVLDLDRQKVGFVLDLHRYF